MFFVLSKTLGFIALPSNLMVVLGLLGLVLTRTRLAGAGWRLVVASVLLEVAFGALPLGDAMMEPLEDRFPRWDASAGVPAGMVVLGGAIGWRHAATRGVVDINAAAERITAIADLARRYPAARIIYSGGDGRLVGREGGEAEYAVDLLETLGIPRGRIISEDKSRNTFENAVFSKALAAPRPGERWLVVTSAWHMPRAIGTFRQAGFPVEAYPVDWRTGGAGGFLAEFEPAASRLQITDIAAREWVGLAAYWITGKSAALFPRP